MGGIALFLYIAKRTKLVMPSVVTVWKPSSLASFCRGRKQRLRGVVWVNL